MIPYFQIPGVMIGGFAIHAFEILTALGIYLGIRYAMLMGRKRNLSEKNMIDAILVSIFTGFIGAHLMHVALYEKDFSHPEKFFEFSKGISSTGGFIAGAIGGWMYLRIKKLSITDYGDCLLAGLILAQFVGRLGCFTAHDHPGSLTTFPLAVMFPDGPRHDLGFEEAILLGIFLLISHVRVVCAWLDQKKGRWIISILFFYGSIRFALDFLRAKNLPNSDPRYAGLTPAQYACIGFILLGIALICSRKKPLNSIG